MSLKFKGEDFETDLDIKRSIYICLIVEAILNYLRGNRSREK